jgi:hypothetical protein
MVHPNNNNHHHQHSMNKHSSVDLLSSSSSLSPTPPVLQTLTIQFSYPLYSLKQIDQSNACLSEHRLIYQITRQQVILSKRFHNKKSKSNKIKRCILSRFITRSYLNTKRVIVPIVPTFCHK